MAEDQTKVPVKEEGKTPEINVEKETTIAPPADETTGSATETPDVEDVEDVLALLNSLDGEIGGKGEITEIPDALRGSIKYMVNAMNFIRDRFADPKHKAILDDLYDQEEDGKTPSLMVAIARTFLSEDIDKIKELADSEDYESAQTELSDALSASKAMEEEDAVLDANYEETKKAGEAYAAEMGYDEAETSALFQVVLDLLKITGDGKLTIEEWRMVDKMRNYDKDTEDLRSQIPSGNAKEVLPDQASVEAAIQKPKSSTPRENSGPGLSSMSAYDNVGTDITQVKGQKRRGM